MGTSIQFDYPHFLMYNKPYMAETIPTGPANPDTTQNQQEDRRQRRRNLARQAVAQEGNPNPETRAQAATLEQTNTAEVGSGLLWQIGRFPVDAVRATGRLGWRVTKFGGRAAVGTVKYPAMAGGMTLLAGGLGTGKAINWAGKGIKFALGPGVKAGIHYDKKFGEGFDNAWKMTREHVGIKAEK